MNTLIVALVIASTVLAAPWNEKKQQLYKHQSKNQYMCPDGWMRFHESCYFTERSEKLPFRQAEKRCEEIGATLFVANSKEEFRTVIMAAPLNAFTWIGLYKQAEADTPTFAADDSMDFHSLDWLNQPYGNAVNGWTTVSQCAAHFNPATEIGKYTFWYPCSYAFHYVCERNQTLSH